MSKYLVDFFCIKVYAHGREKYNLENIKGMLFAGSINQNIDKR